MVRRDFIENRSCKIVEHCFLGIAVGLFRAPLGAQRAFARYNQSRGPTFGEGMNSLQINVDFRFLRDECAGFVEIKAETKKPEYREECVYDPAAGLSVAAQFLLKELRLK